MNEAVEMWDVYRGCGAMPHDNLSGLFSVQGTVYISSQKFYSGDAAPSRCGGIGLVHEVISDIRRISESTTSWRYSGGR